MIQDPGPSPDLHGGLPDPEDGRLMSAGPFGMGPDEARAAAREVLDEYQRAKERRRYRDLTAEKYLLHIDGEGDSQWADILDGGRVDVPPSLPGGIRLQQNLLRPLTENAVAYHTAQEYAVVAEAGPSRESRDRARIDTIFGNAVIQRTELNNVVAEGLFFAAAYGHSPIHATWRDDLTSEYYEPVFDLGELQQLIEMEGMDPEMAEQMAQQIRRGKVDFWCGDPWATVYNEGATRSSVHYMTYARVLPLNLVRQAFGHIPWIDDLEGRSDLPSASRYQRTVRRWAGHHRGRHGTGAVWGGPEGGEELVGTLSKEWAPGYHPDFPEGRLQIIGLSGATEADLDSPTAGSGDPILLHDGPLPGGKPSATRFYMSFRGDDVLGKPYVADLDDLQVQLNQLVTLEHEYVRRYARPPFLVGPGGLVDDTVVTDDDAILEVAADTGVTPQFMFPPQGGQNIYQQAIERVESQIFRLGGWQAASRGESRSGDPAAKVVALMKADDTIFGPVNSRIRESVASLLGTAHALAKEYMFVPMDVGDMSGDDLAHLHEPYISREDLGSDPRYKVVSGYGATPEATGQQLLRLVTMQGADGRPLMSTEEFWRRYPDHTIRPPEMSANDLRERKALRVNWLISRIADSLMEQIGEEAGQFAPYAVQQIEAAFPIERTDIPPMHIETLDMIVQDPDASPLAQQIARMRQFQYFQIMQGMQPDQPEGEAPPEDGGQPQPQRRGGGGGSQGGAEGVVGAPPTPDRPADADLSGTVRSLSREAGVV